MANSSLRASILPLLCALSAACAQPLVPRQVVELARNYVTVPSNSIGTDSEQEILAKEMQRDMVASIMRRIDAALQATGPVGDEMPSPADAAPEPPAEQPAGPSAPPPTP